jgi:hypothetical protein
MVYGRYVRRDADRTRPNTAYVGLSTLQSKIAREIASVAFKTIEYGRRDGIMRQPPRRDNCGCARVNRGANKANPFISPLALSHSGLTGPEN